MTHGADSSRRVEPVANELIRWSEHLAEVAPWACGPPHASTVAAWAWAEARVLLVRRWLDEQPLVNVDGEVPQAATYLERLEKRAQTLRSELGLGPMSGAKLLAALRAAAGGDGASVDGVEALRAEGRRILDARSELVASEGDNDDG